MAPENTHLRFFSRDIGRRKVIFLCLTRRCQLCVQRESLTGRSFCFFGTASKIPLYGEAPMMLPAPPECSVGGNGKIFLKSHFIWGKHLQAIVPVSFQQL